MAYYVICDDDSKHEGMTKEQILAAIVQAVETGSIGNIDTGIVSKVKERNTGGYVAFWVGTTAQYNALEETDPNCIYIKTDCTEYTDLLNAIEAANRAINSGMVAIGEKVSKTGDAMTGTLTLKGIKLTPGVDYGDTLPAAGTPGRLFFKKVSS